MGAGISGNYDNITPAFNIGFWKVNNATSKTTKEEVSLWLFDYDSFQQAGNNKKEREAFLDGCLYSIQQIKRLHHPRVLKIIEASENLKALNFSSEHVISNMKEDTDFTLDDDLYLAYQLAEGIEFLHNQAKVVNLCINTETVCITRDLQLKISIFNFCSNIINDFGGTIPRQGNWVESVFQPPLNFSSPEYTNNAQITVQSDIFSYGVTVASIINKHDVFNATTPRDLIGLINSGVPFPPGVSQDLVNMLLTTLNPVPERRPRINDIMISPAFNTLAVKSLQYTDLILTKDPGDKLNFFKGMTQNLNGFSLRILSYRLLPIFVNDLKLEPKYGPILIPMIFEIGRCLNGDDFASLIMKPLNEELLTFTSADFSLSEVYQLPIIIDRTPEGLHFEVVYPIISKALQCNIGVIQDVAAENFDAMVQKMDPLTVQDSLIPAMIEMMSSSSNLKLICLVTKCLGNCATRVSQDPFADKILPRIQAAWNRLSGPPELAEPISFLFSQMEPTISLVMEQMIPLAGDVLSAPNVSPITQLKLCDYIKQTMERFNHERRIGESEEKWSARNSKLASKSRSPAMSLNQFSAQLGQQSTEDLSQPRSQNPFSPNYENPYESKPKPETQSSVQPVQQSPPPTPGRRDYTYQPRTARRQQPTYTQEPTNYNQQVPEQSYGMEQNQSQPMMNQNEQIYTQAAPRPQPGSFDPNVRLSAPLESEHMAPPPDMIQRRTSEGSANSMFAGLSQNTSHYNSTGQKKTAADIFSGKKLAAAQKQARAKKKGEP